MGFYVDVHKLSGRSQSIITKEDWLTENALEIAEQQVYAALKDPNYGKDNLIICYVINPMFTAAGIAVDRQELQRFLFDDGRHKVWFTAPREKLLSFIPKDPDWRNDVGVR